MLDLPAGTVTFLFTDIESSGAPWERSPEAMREALARRRALLRREIERFRGYTFKEMGDALYAVFDTAPDAVAAALAGQRALSRESWGEDLRLPVRMALHSGSAHERGGDYYGPTLNRAARLLSAGHGGQILLSLATAELVRNELPQGMRLRDLGEHLLRDLILRERIFQLLAPDLPDEFPPLRTLDSRPNNLPAQLTPLVGRKREVAGLKELLLRGDVRLVTLTGAGGTGKTRLALQAAADLLDAFPGGAYFVALTSVTDPTLIGPTIARTLGLRETAGQPVLESLKASLQFRELLLLVDNFEQVTAGAPVVAELLGACPKLKVLATSRSPLRLQAEHIFLVPPLDVPPPKRAATPAEMMEYAAVRLFSQRAQAVQPEFTLSAENAGAIAEICMRLDGLPLALELAAARIDILPPKALLQRLRGRLELLTGGARDLPARQRTLRSAIGWSYDLLDEIERRLFRRLSVFAGGVALEAAEAVCNAAGDLGMDLLDGFSSLVDKSLLRRVADAGEEPRFGMLETIREFGLERLAESGEARAIQSQHASFFLKLAEAAEPRYKTPERTAWITRLNSDYDNLGAALESSGLESGGEETALRLAGSLFSFWYARGLVSEGRVRLERVLARSPAASRTPARARALSGAGRLALIQGDYAAAHSLLEQGVSIWRETADEHGLVEGLAALGRTKVLSGDVPAGRAFLHEGLEISRRLGDRWQIAFLLFHLGEAAFMEREYGEARAHFEESQAMFRELRDAWALNFPLSYLGELARIEGDYRRAGAFYKECLAVSRQQGVRWNTAMYLHNLAYVALNQGDHRKAAALFRESLDMAHKLGTGRGIALCLAGLGGVAVQEGQPEIAARLFGAAEVLLEASGIFVNPADRAEHDRDIGAARATLGEETFARALAEGRRMTLAQAITIGHDVAVAESRMPASSLSSAG